MPLTTMATSLTPSLLPRALQVTLTKVDSKGAKLKSELIVNVQEAVDTYPRIFCFAYENMRSTKFKKVRSDFRDSRFFMGKNKVRDDDPRRPHTFTRTVHPLSHLHTHLRTKRTRVTTKRHRAMSRASACAGM